MSAAGTRTRVKICGITRAADAAAAVAAGADALGFNFWEPSKRYIEPAVAAAIIADLPPFVVSVGLFVDAPPERLSAVLDAVPLDLIQFHGDETARTCAGAGRPYVKAVRMRDDVDVAAAADNHRAARALLLDAYRPGLPGGTGVSFDWSRIPPDLSRPVVLAGGLEPGNVGRAINEVRPFAVDVSGGVESAPGIKDVSKMMSFVAEVRRADAI